MKYLFSLRWNLLDRPPLKRLVRSPWFPLLFQVLALAAMAALAVNGWGLGADVPAQDLMTLRKTNLTTLVVWGLWWPGMIVLALAAGRLWCTVCPMELVSRAGHALGRKLAIARLPMGRFLRSGWAILGAYGVLQLLVAGLTLHRVPHFTSLMLAALGGLALGVGILFREERAFCKSFCPAAALLSVYGRFTPVQLDTVDSGTCQACASRDCIQRANRDRFDGRSCPSAIRPYDRQPSDGCVLCFQCAKVCPHANIGFGSAPAAAGSRRFRLLKPFEAGFVMIAAGFVAHEVVGEVKGLDALFHRPPAFLAGLWPRVGFGWFEALWFLLIFPAVFWSLVAFGARFVGHRERPGSLLFAAATGAAPVIALAHVAKALAKLGSWGGFLPLALRDPRGMLTLKELGNHQVHPPAPLWGFPVLGWLLLGGILLLGWRTLGWHRGHAEREQLPGLRMGFLGAAACFAVVFMIWTRG